MIQNLRQSQVQSDRFLFVKSDRELVAVEEGLPPPRISERDIVEIEVNADDVEGLSQKQSKIFRGGSDESFRPSLVDQFAPSNEECYVDLHERAQAKINGDISSKEQSIKMVFSQSNNCLGSNDVSAKEENYFSYGNEQVTKKKLQSSPEFSKKVFNLIDYRPINVKSLDSGAKVLFGEGQEKECRAEELRETRITERPTDMTRNEISFQNNTISTDSKIVQEVEEEEEPEEPERDPAEEPIDSEKPRNSETLSEEILTEGESKESDDLPERESESEGAPERDMENNDTISLTVTSFSLDQLEFIRKLSTDNIRSIRRDVQLNLRHTDTLSEQEQPEKVKMDDKFNRSQSFTNERFPKPQIEIEIDMEPQSRSVEGLERDANQSEGSSSPKHTESQKIRVIDTESADSVSDRVGEESYPEFTENFEMTENSDNDSRAKVVSLNLNLNLNLDDSFMKTSHSVKSEQPQLRFGKRPNKKPKFNVENNLGKGGERTQQLIISTVPLELDNNDTVHRMKIDSLGKSENGIFARAEDRHAQDSRQAVTPSGSKVASEVILIEGLNDFSARDHANDGECPMKSSFELDSMNLQSRPGMMETSNESNWYCSEKMDLDAKRSENNDKMRNYSSEKVEPMYSSSKLEGVSNLLRRRQSETERSSCRKESDSEGQSSRERAKLSVADKQDSFSMDNLKEEFVIDILDAEAEERLNFSSDKAESKQTLMGSDGIQAITEVTEESRTRDGSCTNDLFHQQATQGSGGGDSEDAGLQKRHVRRHSTESKYVLVGGNSEQDLKENLQKLIDSKKSPKIEDQPKEIFQFEMIENIKQNVNSVQKKMLNYYKSEGNLVVNHMENSQTSNENKKNQEMKDGWKSAIEFEKQRKLEESRGPEQRHAPEVEELAKRNLEALLAYRVYQLRQVRRQKVREEETETEHGPPESALGVGSECVEKTRDLGELEMEEQSSDCEGEKVRARDPISEEQNNLIENEVRSEYIGSDSKGRSRKSETGDSKLSEKMQSMDDFENTLESEKMVDKSETEKSEADAKRQILSSNDVESENSLIELREGPVERPKIEEMSEKTINFVLLLGNEPFLVQQLESEHKIETGDLIRRDSQKSKAKMGTETTEKEKNRKISFTSGDSVKLAENLRESNIVRGDTRHKMQRPSFNFSKKQTEEINVIDESEMQPAKSTSENLRESIIGVKKVTEVSDFSITNTQQESSHLIKIEMINRSAETSGESFYDDADNSQDYYEDEPETKSEYFEPREHFSIEDMEMVDIIRMNRARNFRQKESLRISEFSEIEDSEYYSYPQQETEDSNWSRQSLDPDARAGERSESRSGEAVSEQLTEEERDKAVYQELVQAQKTKSRGETGDQEASLRSGTESPSLNLLRADEELGEITIETNKPTMENTLCSRLSLKFPESMTTENKESLLKRTIKSMTVNAESDLGGPNRRGKESQSMLETDDLESNDITVSNLVNERTDWVIKSEVRGRQPRERVSAGMDYIEMKRKALEKMDLRKSDNMHAKMQKNVALVRSNENFDNDFNHENKADSMEEIVEESLGIEYSPSNHTQSLGSRTKGLEDSGRSSHKSPQAKEGEVEEGAEQRQSEPERREVVGAEREGKEEDEERAEAESRVVSETKSGREGDAPKKNFESSLSSNKKIKVEAETVEMSIDQSTLNLEEEVNTEKEQKFEEQKNESKRSDLMDQETVKNKNNEGHSSKENTIEIEDLESSSMRINSKLPDKHDFKKKFNLVREESQERQKDASKQIDVRKESMSHSLKKSESNSVLRSANEMGHWEQNRSGNASDRNVPPKSFIDKIESERVKPAQKEKSTKKKQLEYEPTNVVESIQTKSENEMTVDFEQHEGEEELSGNEPSEAGNLEMGSIKTKEKFQVNFEDKVKSNATVEQIVKSFVYTSNNTKNTQQDFESMTKAEDTDGKARNLEQDLVSSTNLVRVPNQITESTPADTERLGESINPQSSVVLKRQIQQKIHRPKPVSKAIPVAQNQSTTSMPIESKPYPKLPMLVQRGREESMTSMECRAKVPNSIENSWVRQNAPTSKKSTSLKRSIVTFVNAIDTDNLKNSVFITKEQFERYKTHSNLPRGQVKPAQHVNRGRSLNPMPVRSVSKSPPQVIRRVQQKVLNATSYQRIHEEQKQSKSIPRRVAQMQNLYRFGNAGRQMTEKKVIRSQSPNVRRISRMASYEHVKPKVVSRRKVNDPFVSQEREKKNFILRNKTYVREYSVKKKQERESQRMNQSGYRGKYVMKSRNSILQPKYAEKKVTGHRIKQESPIRRVVQRVMVGKPKKKYLEKLKMHGHDERVLSRKKYLEKFSIHKNRKVKKEPKKEIDMISENIERSKSPKYRNTYYKFYQYNYRI